MTERAPHRRAASDPEFLRRVTAAYRGNVAVLDALWWVEHPSLPSPDGRPSPEARRRELQRTVFSRRDEDADPIELDELARLEHDLIEQRRAIDEAIAAASGDDDTPSVEAAGSTASAEAKAQVRPVAHEHRASMTRPDRSPRISPRWRRTSVAVAIVGSALFGVMTGEVIGQVGRPTVAALTIFDRPQRDDDRLVLAGVGESIPALPSNTIRLDTVRFLESVGPRRVFAAREGSTRICLLASTVDGEEISATCLRDEDFPDGGVRLSFTGSLARPAGSTTDTPGETAPWAAKRAFYTVRWSVDGSLESSLEALTVSSVG